MADEHSFSDAVEQPKLTKTDTIVAVVRKIVFIPEIPSGLVLCTVHRLESDHCSESGVAFEIACVLEIVWLTGFAKNLMLSPRGIGEL
jgi:hypothetical protein